MGRKELRSMSVRKSAVLATLVCAGCIAVPVIVSVVPSQVLWWLVVVATIIGLWVVMFLMFRTLRLRQEIKE